MADLGRHNERAWFESHRSDYEKLYGEPAKVFVTAIAPRLERLAPGLGPRRMRPSLFRAMQPARHGLRIGTREVRRCLKASPTWTRSRCI
jgi:uncharacterized protein (DUF2461 family)